MMGKVIWIDKKIYTDIATVGLTKFKGKNEHTDSPQGTVYGCWMINFNSQFIMISETDNTAVFVNVLLYL